MQVLTCGAMRAIQANSLKQAGPSPSQRRLARRTSPSQLGRESRTLWMVKVASSQKCSLWHLHVKCTLHESIFPGLREKWMKCEGNKSTAIDCGCSTEPRLPKFSYRTLVLAFKFSSFVILIKDNGRSPLAGSTIPKNQGHHDGWPSTKAKYDLSCIFKATVVLVGGCQPW